MENLREGAYSQMYLLSRQKKIYWVIYKKGDYVTSAELAAETGVTSRTIKSDVAKLNEFLADYQIRIQSKTGSGYRLIVSPESRLKEVCCLFYDKEADEIGKIPNSREERAEYIQKKLLRLDSYITLDALCEELYVSRSTMDGDMEQVRRFFALYEIEVIRRSHRGIQLEGTEISFRRCIAKLFFNSKFFGDNDTYASNDRELLSYILQTLKKTAAVYNECYSEEVYREIAVQILIGLYRSRRNKNVSCDLKIKLLPRFMDMASCVGWEIAKRAGTDLRSEELWYIAVLLQYRKLQQIETADKDRYNQVIEQIFDEIKRKLGINLYDSQELKESLLQHLPLMIDRCKNHIAVENPILNDIVCHYPIAVDVTNIAVQILEEEFQIEVNLNEFGYLALYFNMTVMSYSDRQNKTIILTCPGSRAETAMYFTKLNSIFGNFVNSIKVCQLDELRQMQFTGNEIVISTVSLPFLPQYVKSFLLHFDSTTHYADIMNAITAIPLGAFNMDELTDRSMWKVNACINTPEEYYESLFNSLCEIQKLDFGEASILYDNIEPFGQELGNQVVLIRSVDRFVQPFLHITITKEAFIWEKEYVRIIIFVNFANECYEFRNNVYEVLKKWYGNKELINETIKTADFDEFMKTVR